MKFELIVKNLNQLKQIIEDLLSKFPKLIRSYTYFSVAKSHKWIDIPEE